MRRALIGVCVALAIGIAAIAGFRTFSRRGIDERVLIMANTAAEGLSSGDLDRIEGYVFDGAYAPDVNVRGQWPEEANDREYYDHQIDVLSSLLSRSEVAAIDLQGDAVCFHVTAADMEGLPEALMADADDLPTQQAIDGYLFDYIGRAPEVETDVAVPFSVEGEEVAFDFATAEFIDAYTGHFLEVYGQMNDQAIDAIEDSLS